MARGPRKPRWFVNKNRNKRNLQTNNQTKNKKKWLLNMGKEKEFLFDLNEVLEASDVAENFGVLRANVLKKASQNGIDEAIEYIEGIEGDIIKKDTSIKIKRLLKRYSVMRA